MMHSATSQRAKVSIAAILFALLAASGAAEAARKERLDLRHTPLELPGAPSTILPADVDGDGRQDLVVAVAYTEWDQIGIEETTEMDDVDGLVEVLTIVPSLMDRRELWVFLALEQGGYRALAPIDLERSILSLEAGPPGLPIIALTDDGLSVLRVAGDEQRLEPLLSESPILARTGNFIPDLGLGHDLDADGRQDVLFPTAYGAAVYLSRDGGLDSAATWRLVWPADDGSKSRMVRRYPLPEVRDVDGDGLPDLLLYGNDDEWEGFSVLLNVGGGRFGEPVAPLGEEPREQPGDGDRVADGDSDGDGDGDDSDENDRGSVVHFGDLDGDGIAEWVTQQELGDQDAGMRKEIREAKRPPYRYRLYRTRSDLSMETEPYLEFEATGYAFDGDSDIRLPGGFQDLDGDGRSDLVTLTLDFSMLQAVRILATHRISIGMDFHVWCQGAGGRYRAVTGLDLSGKFRLDLDDLRIGQLSQFAGDFDADGRADFLQMGRGRDVTIHRGREGCVYPTQPDLTLRLEEEPRDLKLVQVRDLDADGRSDLLVIQPQKVTEPGVTPPVRLDLYLSGGDG